MNLFAVQRILGLLLMLFSVTMLPPAAIGWWYGETNLHVFPTAFGLLLLMGLLIWLPAMRHHVELRIRDGFLVVVLFWAVLGLSGAVPLALADRPALSLTDAVFESISGLTTTGGTVIVGLDSLPRSILYYRQQLQWLGGMGIIVLAVAVLPMLGIGGMQLYRAETPGPVKDNKLTPRIAETAKALWYIYLGLTLACVLAYWAAGMSLFDAVGHAFSTVAIGGFSHYDASLGHFSSSLIEMIAVLFMLVAGVNFALHFSAWRGKELSIYWRDSEFLFYLSVMGLVSLITILGLYLSGTYSTWGEAFTRGLFHAISVGTTTGFTTAEFYYWPGFLAILLLFTSFMGACAGSTGGGIKAIRFLLLVKQGVREVNQLVHPNAQIPIRVGQRTIPSRVIDAVWGFFALYVASFTFMYLALALTGIDLMTAFSAVGACMNNLGPGLAQVGPHYADLNDPAKWILCFAMLLGRLEIFTLLVLFTPAFWEG